MANGMENLDLFQKEEIIRGSLNKEELSFECPNCGVEINEALFGKDGQRFRLLIDKFMTIAKGRWLKEIEESKKYEEFAGFANLQKRLVEREKAIEDKNKSIEALKVEISSAYGSDKVESLVIVKDLRKKLEEKQKEVENLRIKNQPEIKKLEKDIETLQVKLSGAYSSDKIENLSRTQELKKELEERKKHIEKLKESITKLQSSEEVEKLGRVKDLKTQISEVQKENEELKERNRDLVISKSKDSQKKGEDFEKWFFEELVKVFDGFDNIKDISRGQIGTGKRADFLQEVLTETEPKKIAGRIIYETKNTEKWDDHWVVKLEKDMQTHGADYGIIVATCEKEKVIKKAQTVDWKKKIYISGDNSNLFLTVKIMRELLINKYNLMKIDDNSVDKEQKLKKIEEWANDKLPNHILNLQKQLDNQERYANSIITGAEKIKKSKGEITRLTMININEEMKKLLK